LELTRETLLKFNGTDLTIEAADPHRAPTIRLNYDIQRVDQGSWTSIVIRATGLVRIRNIRFVLDAHQADIDMAALAVESGRLHVENCEFEQLRPAADIGRVYSIVVAGINAVGDKPRLVVRSSYFAGGQHAVRLLGDASFTQTAFAPHQASLFDLDNP